MKPVGDMVLVGVVEEQGVLITVNNNYGVVKVLAKPGIRPSSESMNRDIWDSLAVGDKLLVNSVKDYVVEDKKHYFTILSDIVCIL